ncbi:hypothetical protein HU200_043235 [Digitaria exilis]|uniref:Uncharacterized protein n=1 Tax=Digitaria exilis TaxID=1010633 RepID=A0A835B0W8_9POAL|nr:hypothetical protein HU200_043235 [Digitaria exilis]
MEPALCCCVLSVPAVNSWMPEEITCYFLRQAVASDAAVFKLQVSFRIIPKGEAAAASSSPWLPELLISPAEPGKPSAMPRCIAKILVPKTDVKYLEDPRSAWMRMNTSGKGSAPSPEPTRLPDLRDKLTLRMLLYCLTVRGVQVQQTVIQQHNSHAHAGVMAPLPTVAVCNSVLHPPFGKTALPRLMLGLSRFRHTRIFGCDSYQSESLGGTVPKGAPVVRAHLREQHLTVAVRL